MTLRRRGAMGKPERRTQGAFVAALRARPRTPYRAGQCVLAAEASFVSSLRTCRPIAPGLSRRDETYSRGTTLLGRAPVRRRRHLRCCRSTPLARFRRGPLSGRDACQAITPPFCDGKDPARSTGKSAGAVLVRPARPALGAGSPAPFGGYSTVRLAARG